MHLRRLVVVIVVDVKPVRAVLLIAHRELENRGGKGIFRIDVCDNVFLHIRSCVLFRCKPSDQMQPFVDSTPETLGSMDVAMSRAFAKALNIASRM